MKYEKEPRGSNFFGKQVSRRTFLRTSAVAAGGAALAAAVGCDFEPQEATSTPTAEAEVWRSEISAINTSGEVVRELDGYTIYFDAASLPIKYEDPSGEEFKFDSEEMNQKRLLAKSAREPVIVKAFIIEQSAISREVTPAFAIEHPTQKDKPKDVLSTSDLAAHRVEIVQANRTQLHIRKPAFEGELPLARLNNDLKIVLMDSDFVSPLYLTGSEYSRFARILGDPMFDAVSARQGLLSKLDEDLNKVRLNFDMNYVEKQNKMNENKLRRYLYESLYNDEDIKDVAAAQAIKKITGDTPVGLFARGMLGADVIFLAVGSGKPDRSFINIYFDADGNSQVEKSFFLDRKAHSVDKRQSYPNPDIYPRYAATCQENNYPIGGVSVGFGVRHELGHVKLMTQQELSNNCEADTDMYAYGQIVEAWNKWNDSGFKDNSGYYFVLTLPDGTNILTSANQESLQKAV